MATIGNMGKQNHMESLEIPQSIKYRITSATLTCSSHGNHIKCCGIPSQNRIRSFPRLINNMAGFTNIWETVNTNHQSVACHKLSNQRVSLTSDLAASPASNKQSSKRLFNVTLSLSHSFQLEPNRNYSTSIKIFNCAGASQSIDSSGSCTGRPGVVKCVDGFELLLFSNENKNYTEAKSSCESQESYLVKVDNQNITDAIKPVLDQIRKPFFIGGNDIAKEGDWKWQDETDVIMRGEEGYQNWGSVEPNSGGEGNEDCLIVGFYGNSWVDYTCKEKINYICQKKFQGPFLTVEKTSKAQRTCAKTKCNPGNNVEWYAKSLIPTDPNKSVYQTKKSGSAILHLQNADISDAVDYYCSSWLNGVKKGEYTFKHEVEGTPTITHIQKYTCNSSLLISWEPHKNAVGFPHKILVGERWHEVKWVTPQKLQTQSTLINNLDSDTTYEIRIRACLSSDVCTQMVNIWREVKTGGKTLSAKYVSFKQIEENETCVISWDLINEESIKLYTVELVLNSILVTTRSSEIQNVDSNILNMTSATEYQFQPKPNREYFASVAIFSCAGSSKSLRVHGACRGSSKAPTMVHPPKIVGDSGISKSGEINITIQMPYESNGLISCIFVNVDMDVSETSTEFTMDDLITFNSTADGEKYIALAIEVASMKEKTLNVTLGDESVTQCDIAGFETTHDVPMETDFLFIGTNRKLKKENSPRFLV
uniref:uncharacterized protein LOC120335085 n=1 Tax=Styela clava TaxID=7725 RepID=UPI00193A0421|nr:uncharacterized protein LOC120335085 [Styela clava]